MVYQIRNHRYGVFVESFILAIIIFLIGFSIGFYFENMRLNKVIENYRDNEIEALDLKLQNYYYQIMDGQKCNLAIEQNLIFADKIYNEGLEIEKFEDSNQITDELKNEKKRYVLLKTELWLNSILLKEKCGSPFDTIVYFYESEAGQVKETEQKMISNILKQLKEERGNQIILLPIAGDLNLDIVNLQKNIYNISYLPSLIINEKYVLEGYHQIDEIKNLLD